MSVYLGYNGVVALTRKGAGGSQRFVVQPSEVNTTSRRFTLSFDDAARSDVTNTYLTGDRITLTAASGTLSFVGASGFGDGVKAKQGSWYINVDELGGIRLYTTLANSLQGTQADAVPLDALATELALTAEVKNNVERTLARTTSWELNTNREVVDTTVLSDQFRNQYSALISGSGSLSALWTFNYDPIGTDEYSHYLLQLITRTEIGSEFSARLFLKPTGTGTGNAQTAELYYAFDGLITGAGVQMNPDNAVQISIDFVTTSAIRLLLPTPVDELLVAAGEALLIDETTSRLDL